MLAATMPRVLCHQTIGSGSVSGSQHCSQLLQRSMPMNKISLPLFWFLSVLVAAAQPTNDSWKDTSPHKELFVKANGVSLEYLDWGGQGEAILFLPGLGGTAHIFDNIAPEFTNHFRVLALTRRGCGKSDKPKTDYALDTLATDLRDFLNTLKIRRATLVGHSFGGVEITRFVELFPDRVSKLVYFDACYDYTSAPELLSKVDDLGSRPSNEDRTNYWALHAWFKNNLPGWNDACEANFRDERSPASKYWSLNVTPPEVLDLLVKEAMDFKLDYTKITVPTLSFIADHRPDKLLADTPPAQQANAPKIIDAMRKWQRNEILQFQRQVKEGRVVELADTDHFCFIQRQDKVVAEMKSFLKPR